MSVIGFFFADYHDSCYPGVAFLVDYPDAERPFDHGPSVDCLGSDGFDPASSYSEDRDAGLESLAGWAEALEGAKVEEEVTW